MKYAIAITLYNPIKQYLDNFLNYIENFDEIFLYDNSLDNKNYIDLIPQNHKIHYFFNHSNVGLPYAFNFILNNPYLSTFDYLCTMDQDSYFNKIQINKIQNFIEQNMDKKIAIVAPLILYSNKNITSKKQIIYKDWVICSGSFINLDIIRRHKITYDEKYFIDRFEVDFCKQISQLGYKIIVFSDSILKQELGLKNVYKHSNHSPLRHYYIFRNRLYFNYKFFNKNKAFFISFLQNIKHIILILFFEQLKKDKIVACLKGYIDFRKKKFYAYDFEIKGK